MNIIPMTVEQALEYAPKAALLDFEGPVTPDFIAAMREHLSYAISALNVIADKLYEAEGTILDLHSSNLELAELLKAKSTPTVEHPSFLTLQQVKKMQGEWAGGIDPEYGTQMSFDDVPSREPIEIVEDLPGSPRNPLQGSARGQVTVEFRTDPGTYDANRGAINRMLAEEIVAQFGQNPHGVSTEETLLKGPDSTAKTLANPDEQSKL